ncbi:MAG TPA: MFS transporter [Puia sp.]|nr:MFS transporter [Puia sp.]
MHNSRIKFSIFLNYFLFAILLNSIGTVILLVQSYFRVSEKQAAWLDPFKDFSIAIASFIVGAFISRIGYKKSMLIALASVAIGCFIIPSIKFFWAIKFLCALCGFAFGLTKVSVFGTIGIVTRSEREHLSLMNFIESFFMLGILSGYFLFAHFASDPDTGNWFKAYYYVGVLAVIAFLILLSSPLDESAIQKNPGEWSGEVGGMLKLVILPLVVSFVLCAFFYVLIEQSTMNWLPTFNKKVLHISEALAIIWTSILPSSMAIGRFTAGLLLRKLNWLLVLIGCLIGATSVLLISLYLAKNTVVPPSINSVKDVPLVAFLFPAIGIFLSPIYPVINSLVLATLPKSKHGAMSGLIVVFSAIGGTLGSIITGYLFKEIGGINAFYFSLVPITILAVALVMFNKIKSRQSANLQLANEMLV